jgi:mono/diheme cytochrome c family protein
LRALRSAVPALLVVLALAACGGEEQRRAKPAPKSDPGLSVWAAQGCGTCHSFAPAGSTATIGPNLSHTLIGRSRAYIRQSILKPNAVVVGGGTSVMPGDFAKRISKPQLDALVAFVARGAGIR